MIHGCAWGEPEYLAAGYGKVNWDVITSLAKSGSRTASAALKAKAAEAEKEAALAVQAAADAQAAQAAATASAAPPVGMIVGGVALLALLGGGLYVLTKPTKQKRKNRGKYRRSSKRGR